MEIPLLFSHLMLNIYDCIVIEIKTDKSENKSSKKSLIEIKTKDHS